MRKDFNKVMELIKKSRMTAVEKARIQLEIMTKVENTLRKNTPVISPYTTRSTFFFGYNFMHSFGRMAIVTVLVLTITTGGLSYASTDALPGDLLYPIKINLKEEIEENLTFTPIKKIALRQKRIENRFVEVETLIKEKRITPATLSIVESQIQTEKEKIGIEIEAINQKNPIAAAEAKKEIEFSINKRQEKIDIQIEENEDIDQIEKELGDFDTILEADLLINISSLEEMKKTDEVVAPIEATEEIKSTESEKVTDTITDNGI